MKRRGFLKLFGKVAAGVAVAPVIGAAAEKSANHVIHLHAKHDVPSGGGFVVNKGVITGSKYPKPLWPGLKKPYNESYAKHEVEFKTLLDDDRTEALAKAMKKTKDEVAFNVLEKAFNGRS